VVADAVAVVRQHPTIDWLEGGTGVRFYSVMRSWLVPEKSITILGMVWWQVVLIVVVVLFLLVILMRRKVDRGGGPVRPASASVYVREGTTYVTSQFQTRDGFWIEQEPYFVEEGPTPEVLAERVLEALDASMVDIPTPPRDTIKSRLPGLAGVRSYGLFMKGAITVSVSQDGTGITVTPMKNCGAKRGFEYKDSDALRVEDASKLASILVKALEVAE
jgi:hypothetical protein